MLQLRSRAGRVFTRQAPPFNEAGGGIIGVIWAPPPPGGPPHAFLGQGPVCYHTFLTGTRPDYRWGGGLRRDRGTEY